ncbi:glycosyltransferase family 4 protein [Vibrio sp. 1-Bac 57]
MKNKKLLFIINVDWYFKLHWLPRAIAAKESGFDVIVAAHFSNPAIRTELRTLGFSLKPIFLDRKSINPVNNFKTKQHIAKLIDKIQPDIVHSITVKPNVYSGLICCKRKICQVMSVTGLGLTFSSKKMKAKAAKKIISRLYRKVAVNSNSHILFENEDDRELFSCMRIAEKSRLTVIAGAGVDLTEYSYQEEEENVYPIILFAARMLWDKGLADLVAAAAILRNKGVKFELQVAGILDNQSSAAISELQIEKWNSQGDINWLGEVKDMPKLIGLANIVCLPTTYGEGVPRVLIEAAAIGRAIVTTDVNGCREIVLNNKSGILVPPRDVKALAAALEMLLLDKQTRIGFGLQGRQLVEEKFCQKIVIQRTLEIYNELLVNKSKAK